MDQISIEELQSKVDKLLEVDQSNIDETLLGITSRFGRLKELLRSEGAVLRKVIDDKKKVELYRWKHYMCKLPGEHYKKEPMRETILKTDVPKYVDCDPVVMEIRDVCARQEERVQFVEDALKRLNSLGYELKSVIEFRKLMLGTI